MMVSPLALGIDIGGSNIRVALVYENGTVHSFQKDAIQNNDVIQVISQICAMVSALESDCEYNTLKIVGVGIAAQLLLPEGTVVVAPNLGWRDIPFCTQLSQALARPVRIVNDLNAICRAEASLLTAAQHVMAVFVGTGVGMGAISHGAIVEGNKGLATELGHIKVTRTKHARKCGCGETGCLEAYTSGAHLPKRVQEIVNSGMAASDSSISTISTKSTDFNVANVANVAIAQLPEHQINAGVIDRAWQENDPIAKILWQENVIYLAESIATAITLFNPKTLILGGGVLESAPHLTALVRDRLQRYISPTHLNDLSIVSSQMGDPAGMVGAALLAHDASL